MDDTLLQLSRLLGCSQFATSLVFSLKTFVSVSNLYFMSISSLNSLYLCNKEKKKCQTVIFKRMIHTNFRTSRASEHSSSQTTGPKKKKKKENRIVFVISVSSGSSDSLYATKLQPAVFFYKYSFACKHRNSWKTPRDIFGCLLISVHFFGRSYHGLLFSCRRGGFQQSQSHKVTLLSYLCCKFFLGLIRKFSSSSIQDWKPSQICEHIYHTASEWKWTESPSHDCFWDFFFFTQTQENNLSLQNDLKKTTHLWIFNFSLKLKKTLGWWKEISLRVVTVETSEFESGWEFILLLLCIYSGFWCFEF